MGHRETLGVEVRPELLVEKECGFEANVQGAVELDIEHNSAIMAYVDVWALQGAY